MYTVGVMEPQEVGLTHPVSQGRAQSNMIAPPSGISQPMVGGATPAIAEDSDLIETEWVNALKQTMLHYRNDPYALSQAMTALREDYLMKRYGKRVEPTE